MSTVAESIAEILRDEGFRPQLEDGDVLFKVEGDRFGFETYADDDTYARLITIWSLPTETPLDRALSLANETNLKIKAVKTMISRNGEAVEFTLEQFFGQPESLRPIIERSVRAVKAASNHFFAALNERTTPEPE